MKLPITKIRKAVDHFGEIRVSFFVDRTGGNTANMLLSPEGISEFVIDSETLDKYFGDVPDDGFGLVALDLALYEGRDGEGANVGYRQVWIFDDGRTKYVYTDKAKVPGELERAVMHKVVDKGK